jgi:hypothetical protein
VTRGAYFIQQIRQLGYETACAVEAALSAAEAPPEGVLPTDPFIDPAEEAATRHYLTRVAQAVALQETWPEKTPDPVTFRRAARYYEIECDLPACPREVFPEVNP